MLSVRPGLEGTSEGFRKECSRPSQQRYVLQLPLSCHCAECDTATLMSMDTAEAVRAPCGQDPIISFVEHVQFYAPRVFLREKACSYWIAWCTGSRARISKASNTWLKLTKRPRDGWSVPAVTTLRRNSKGHMPANVEAISSAGTAGRL